MSIATEPTAQIRKKLPVMAISNKGYNYEVELVLRESKHFGLKWVLIIVNTPGQWYISTLLNSQYNPAGSKVMWIDYGQNWRIENFDEVLAAAKAAI